MKHSLLAAALLCVTCANAIDVNSLSTKTLRVAADPGSASVEIAVLTDTGAHSRVEFSILTAGPDAQPSTIQTSGVVKNDAGATVLHIATKAGAEADIALNRAGFVTLTPGKKAAVVEIRTGARYVSLPDFFADDVIFDPTHLSMPKLTVPAENFLMQFLEGGNTIVMCVWPGSLSKRTGDALAKDAPDPQVDLLFSGTGDARRVAASRIEFQNNPVYIGVMERAGIWHDEDVRTLPAYKPAPIVWKRPFEARWRGDFILAEGKTMADWPTRNQTFQFQSTSEARADKWWQAGTDAMDARFAAVASNKIATKWWERGSENDPQIWQESLASFFIYPAVLKGDETRLCLYADKAERSKADKATKAARKADKDAPEVLPPNVYERVIIYPLSRVAATPRDAITPVDLMRETLGAGPCEYVLDLAGVKPRPAGGDRPILSYATCGLWNDHISPILANLKKSPGGTGNAPVPEYVPLDDKTKAHLNQALEEMWYFVHAVHDRLREYKKWGAETADYCKQEAQKNGPSKPVAEKILAQIEKLNTDMARHKFEGPGSELYWKDRVPELIKQVNEGNYAGLNQISKIRDLGNDQDERVSRCRQYVKGALQEILLQDAHDPETRTFAAEVRSRCHKMLRAMHPKEGF